LHVGCGGPFHLILLPQNKNFSSVTCCCLCGNGKIEKWQNLFCLSLATFFFAAAVGVSFRYGTARREKYNQESNAEIYCVRSRFSKIFGPLKLFIAVISRLAVTLSTPI